MRRRRLLPPPRAGATPPLTCHPPALGCRQPKEGPSGWRRAAGWPPPGGPPADGHAAAAGICGAPPASATLFGSPDALAARRGPPAGRTRLCRARSRHPRVTAWAAHPSATAVGAHCRGSHLSPIVGRRCGRRPRRRFGPRRVVRPARAAAISNPLPTPPPALRRRGGGRRPKSGTLRVFPIASVRFTRPCAVAARAPTAAPPAPALFGLGRDAARTPSASAPPPLPRRVLGVPPHHGVPVVRLRVWCSAPLALAFVAPPAGHGCRGGRAVGARGARRASVWGLTLPRPPSLLSSAL